MLHACPSTFPTGASGKSSVTRDLHPEASAQLTDSVLLLNAGTPESPPSQRGRGCGLHE
jgi:hypothetical protein